MPHRVTFLIEVRAPNGSFSVERAAVLDFVPEVGMYFASVFREDDLWVANEVCYDLADRMFHVAFGSEEWTKPLTVESARELIAFGCTIDDHDDADRLASKRLTPMPVEPEQEPIPYDITLKLSAMPEVARLLEGLSADLRKSSAETIIQALVMLKIIVDAGKEGKRLAITNDDLNVEREILIPGRSDDDA